jgi:hypothetical protein
VHAKDDSGWTALHTAASFGTCALCWCLCVNVVRMTRSAGHPALCEALLQHSTLSVLERCARDGGRGGGARVWQQFVHSYVFVIACALATGMTPLHFIVGQQWREDGSTQVRVRCRVGSVLVMLRTLTWRACVIHAR